MDIALCTLNNTVYNAFDFSLLPETEKSVLRKELKCIECKGKASYRKESTDNKPPCFSAKHIGLCSKENSSKSSSTKSGKNDVNKVVTDIQIVRLNRSNLFNTPIKINEQQKNSINISKNRENSKRFVLDPTRITTKSKSLRNILYLHLKGALINTRLNIRINNNNFPLNDILFDWETVNTYIDEGFYCGFIRNTAERIWLNSNNSRNLSILLDKTVATTIWNSLPYIKGNWNTGVPVIVYGTPKEGPSGKTYIKISQIENIYISKRHYNKISKVR